MKQRVRKPVFRYHGGKWRVAPWIIRHFPPHGLYVEPFGGAASVLLRKSPAKIEVLNDIYGRVVSCYRVLRDPVLAEKVMRLLRFTPCSELEYRGCLDQVDDPVEDARRMLVIGRQAHGSTVVAGGKKTGWRRGSINRSAAGMVRENDWGAIWQHVLDWADRLRDVYLESKPAVEVIRRWDCADALFYVDPPYLFSTRATRPEGYAHELDDAGHRELAGVLRECAGMVVISGYPSDLYDLELYADWQRVQCAAMADHGKHSTEVLWINPAAVRKMEECLQQKTSGIQMQMWVSAGVSCGG